MKITFRSPKFYAVLTTLVALASFCTVLAEEIRTTSSSDSKKDTEVRQTEISEVPGSSSPETSATSTTSTSSSDNDRSGLSRKTSSGATQIESAPKSAEFVQPPHPTSISLKPGQKLNVTGFAENGTAFAQDPDKSQANSELHKLQMRVSGSMCLSCLLTFEERLNKVYGIERAKVVRSAGLSVQAFSPDLSNWADATIYYDSARISQADLRAYAKTIGYYSYKALDKLADSLPPLAETKSGRNREH